MEHINKNAPLPPALDYAFQAKEFQALPKQGGLREQPVKLMIQMRVALNVWKAVSSYISAPNSAEWAQNNHETWEVVAEALSIAEQYGKQE